MVGAEPLLQTLDAATRAVAQRDSSAEPVQQREHAAQAVSALQTYVSRLEGQLRGRRITTGQADLLADNALQLIAALQAPLSAAMQAAQPTVLPN